MEILKFRTTIYGNVHYWKGEAIFEEVKQAASEGCVHSAAKLVPDIVEPKFKAAALFALGEYSSTIELKHRYDREALLIYKKMRNDYKKESIQQEAERAAWGLETTNAAGV